MSRTKRNIPHARFLRRPKTTQELAENKASVLVDGIPVRHSRQNIPTHRDDRIISARNEQITKP
jgi:hypothetical protein